MTNTNSTSLTYHDLGCYGETILKISVLEVLYEEYKDSGGGLHPKEIAERAGIFRKKWFGRKGGNDFIVLGILNKLERNNYVKEHNTSRSPWELTSEAIENREEEGKKIGSWGENKKIIKALSNI